MKQFVRIFCIFILAAMLSGAGLSTQPVSQAHAVGVPTTYTVNTNGDPGDGVCDLAECTLREAIASANDVTPATADIIDFDSSYFITLASSLPPITDDLTINGTTNTIEIDGNNLYRVMVINPDKVVDINNLTIQSGLTDTPVGVIANSGAGIFNQGILTITNSTFAGNTANDNGGAIYNQGNVTITNSIFSINSAAVGNGAAIYNYYGTVTGTNSAFISNSAGASGGGIFNNAGTLTFSNSAFSDNNADTSGGGIDNEGGTMTITNSTFALNTSVDGGGIFNSGGTAAITNSTFSGNSASGSGGGLRISAGIATLRNTIVANSASGLNCSGMITNGGNNIDSGTSCGWSSISGSMSGTNPLLGTLTGSPAYFPLTGGSPAIDTGKNAICAAPPVNNTSQNGVARPQGTYCDIGAYEALQSFSDVSTSYWAWQYIERLYSAGITGGCSLTPLNYCPDATVTRAQMAVFLLKGIHGSSFAPPAVGTSTGFTDVPVGYWAATWIKQLAAEGITGGCGIGIYCPDATVTRAQIAVFLLKAEHGSSYAPPTATGVFTDVPVGYWARSWIEQLSTEGITGGCGAGVYCPDNSVTRAQMAVFLVKTFSLP